MNLSYKNFIILSFHLHVLHQYRHYCTINCYVKMIKIWWIYVKPSNKLNLSAISFNMIRNTPVDTQNKENTKQVKNKHVVWWRSSCSFISSTRLTNREMWIWHQLIICSCRVRYWVVFYVDNSYRCCTYFYEL